MHSSTARPAAIVVRYAASNEIFVGVDGPHNGPGAREASARGPGSDRPGNGRHVPGWSRINPC